MKTFEDIEGLEDIKKRLEFVLFSNSVNHFIDEDIKPKNMLIYGPDSYRITEFVESLVGELTKRQNKNIEYIQGNLSDMISPILGETKKNMLKPFKRAVQKEPSVLYLNHLEELDKHQDLIADYLMMQSSIEKNDVLLIVSCDKPEELPLYLYRNMHAYFDECYSIPKRGAKE